MLRVRRRARSVGKDSLIVTLDRRDFIRGVALVVMMCRTQASAAPLAAIPTAPA